MDKKVSPVYGPIRSNSGTLKLIFIDKVRSSHPEVFCKFCNFIKKRNSGTSVFL